MSNIGEGLSVETHPKKTYKPVKKIKAYIKTFIEFSFREKKGGTVLLLRTSLCAILISERRASLRQIHRNTYKQWKCQA